MEKAPDAFRTISEVATWLDTPAHVLRFWESRFPQIKPVKRAGGRRYYRREDMELLGGIKFLLHEQGLTIRGVQKILSDQGVRHVASLSMATPGTMPDEPIDATASAPVGTGSVDRPQPPKHADSTPAAAARSADRDVDGAKADTISPNPIAAADPAQAPHGVEPAALAPRTDERAVPAPTKDANESPASDRQPRFAFETAPESMPERLAQGTKAEREPDDLPPQLAARLRAGARISDHDLDTVRRLASRLSALQARLATARQTTPSAR